MDNMNDTSRITELTNLIKEYEELLNQAISELSKYPAADTIKAYNNGTITEEEKNKIFEYRKSYETIVQEIPMQLEKAKLELSNIQNLKKTTKSKKLGIGHIIISYMWLPIIILIRIYETIINVLFSFSNFPNNLNISFLADMVLIIPTLFLGCSVFIAMIRRHSKALITMRLFLAVYCAEYMLYCIKEFIAGEATIIHCSMWILLAIAISFIINKYYTDRNSLLTKETETLIDNNIEDIIQGYFGVCLWLLPIAIEGVSLYYMFNESISYGLFGLFVPVIAQIQFLFHTGFDTSFAYLVYSTVLLFVCFATAFLISESNPQKE